MQNHGMTEAEIIGDVLTFLEYIDDKGWLSLSIAAITKEIRTISQGEGLPDDCIKWMEARDAKA